jgi:hypothetical protein
VQREATIFILGRPGKYERPALGRPPESKELNRYSVTVCLESLQNPNVTVIIDDPTRRDGENHASDESRGSRSSGMSVFSPSPSQAWIETQVYISMLSPSPAHLRSQLCELTFSWIETQVPRVGQELRLGLGV